MVSSHAPFLISCGGIQVLHLKKNKHRSLGLSTLAVLFIIVIIAIPDLLIGLFIYRDVQASSQAQLDSSAANSLRFLDKNLTQFIQGKTHIVTQLSDSLSGKTDNPKDIQSTLGTVQGVDQDEAALYLANRQGALIFLPATAKIPKSLDPRTRPWYKLAMQYPGKPVITAPYLSSDGSNAMTVTIAETTSDGTGVIGMDLKLSKISAIVNQVKVGESGHAFLLDNNYAWVVNSQAKSGGKAPSALIREFAGRSSGSLFQNNQHVYFVTNQLTGWKIGGTMNLNEIDNMVVPLLVNVGLFALITIIIVTVLVWLIVRKYVLKPTARMVSVFEKISKNDFTQGMDTETTSNREFAQLSVSVNHMMGSLKNVVRTIGSKSEMLAASSEELSASTEENKATSDEISRSIQEIALAADEQANNVERLVEEAEAVNQAVGSITERTSNLARTSDESSQIVQNGQDALQITANQMGTIKEKMSNLSQMVNNLSRQSKEIGEIIHVINDIADQTRLLSLNASIEAARAGENGKGFAVVAGEIQKLSAQSAQSANQINDILTVIQQDTEQVVTSMEDGIHEVDKGMSAVSQSGSSFDNIKSFVNTVSEQIKNVTAAIHDISTSTAHSVASFQPIKELASQTSSNAQNVSAATEEQSASTEEVARSATALSTIADELNQLVATFKIKA